MSNALARLRLSFPTYGFSHLQSNISPLALHHLLFLTQVFALYIMIALWMIVISHTFVNITFYTGMKKVRLISTDLVQYS